MAEGKFNLETAFDTWRSFFEQRQSFLDDDLEELEQHVREHVTDLVSKDTSEEEAFRIATAHVGGVTALDEAYDDVRWRKLRHKQRLIQSVASQLAMIGSYSTVAFRNLLKYKGYNALNIAGLAVGLAWAVKRRSVSREFTDPIPGEGECR
jgi:hypothetical protein